GPKPAEAVLPVMRLLFLIVTAMGMVAFTKMPPPLVAELPVMVQPLIVTESPRELPAPTEMAPPLLPAELSTSVQRLSANAVPLTQRAPPLNRAELLDKVQSLRVTARFRPTLPAMAPPPAAVL